MKKKLVSLTKIILGNAIMAFCIIAFILPTGILVGGTAGIGIAFNHFFGLNMSLIVIAVNVFAFIAGLLVFGKNFAFRTIVSTLVFPMFFDMFTRIDNLSKVSDDLLLCAIMAGLLAGYGLGLVLDEGASTGGTDIPPLILSKYTGIAAGTGMLMMNLIVLAIQLPYSTIEQVLYGIINTVLMSAVLNYMYVAGKRKIQILAISAKSEEIRQVLIANDVGTTLINVESGYQKKPAKAILCVFNPRQLFMMKQKILEVDPSCFMTINSVNEVGGQGFSRDREYVEELRA